MYTYIYLTILGIIFILFSYIYIRPWLKGTYKYAKNPNCKFCKEGSSCCKYPGQDDKEGWCMSKKCDSIQLESPSDDQISFFSKFSIFSLILIIIIFTIEVYLKYKKSGKVL